MNASISNEGVTNITLVGVGGQGILLTADILARTAALAGLTSRNPRFTA